MAGNILSKDNAKFIILIVIIAAGILISFHFALNTEDMYGISCTVCHSYIDPLSYETAKIIKDVPPGYGNAMMVSDPQNVVRGPVGGSTWIQDAAWLIFGKMIKGLAKRSEQI